MSEKDSPVSFASIEPIWPATTREALYPADAEALQEDFKREQEKLFVGEDEIEIVVIEFKNGGTDISMTEEEETRLMVP
jgi:hypothetical protein